MKKIKNNLPYLKATAEMLNNEELIVAVTEQLLHDEMVALVYDSSARQFMLWCDKYRLVVDNDHNVIHFEIINDGLFMTVHPSKMHRRIFKDVKNEYMRMHLKCLYDEYCD